MPRRLRPALVRGRRAALWEHWDGCLILRGSERGEETEVPIAHLVDEGEMEQHFRRLREKRWVTDAAIVELEKIVAGARA